MAAAWDHAGIRLELLALEAAEERSRLVAAIVAAAGLVVCVALTLAFVGLALLAAAWDTPHRMLVVAALAGGYGIAGVYAWLSLRELLRQPSQLFGRSVAVWRSDVDAPRR